MSSDLVIRTESLGGTPLSQFMQRGEAPADWHVPTPRRVEAWRSRIESIRADQGGGWWEAIGPACAASGAAVERLARVAARNGVVVTSGQQPGLFGGPAYTWFKALSALALADLIEGETGVPAAPVFWAATDDTDFDEASWTAVAMPGGAARLELTGRPAEGVRMGDAALGDVRALMAELERACGSAADPTALRAVKRAYTPDATIGGAYVRLLRALLEPLGIAVLDATHPSVGDAADALLRRALRERETIAHALAERTAAIRAAGFEPQVEVVAGRTLVFELAGGRRERVAFDRAEAAAATAKPGALSGNVLLRPVLERWLLPTVAYMAGPGEIAYFAQVSAVADALGVARPVALPRWSGTLIEPHVSALLRAYQLDRNEFAEPNAVEARLARAAWPAAVEREFATLREALARQVAALRETMVQEESLLPPEVVEGVGRGLEWRLKRLERRITAAVKRREGRLMHELGTIRGALFPLGVRQERALNLVPLLARHGLDLLPRLREAAEGHARDLVGVRAARAVAR
ncbi:MAG TPA: bacillithiol biosynthesis cysteine-adding enzyme BshC [Gemmatimonadaceae bacterium]|nr:bacillithiol biosynthesis cysteine-adding enzyme BshC [Gemmatimonadaceae bacterium]